MEICCTYNYWFLVWSMQMLCDAPSVTGTLRNKQNVLQKFLSAAGVEKLRNDVKKTLIHLGCDVTLQ